MAENKLDYLVLVVLYNKTVQDSETMQSLIRLKNQLKHTKLLLWENSHKPCIQLPDLNILQQDCGAVEYVSTPENLSLSSIYNQVIQRTELTFFNFLILLDHDSVLPDNFFRSLAQATSQRPDIHLFLPIVYSGEEIVSPADLYYFKGIRWKQKKTGPVNAAWKAAINSGMVISTAYLANNFSGYDERFRFYGTDTFFMKKYAQDNEQFYVIDAEIQHHLNYFEQEDLEVKLQRFREIKRSTSLLNEHSFVAKVLTGAYLSAFSVLQAIRFKSIRFIYDK